MISGCFLLPMPEERYTALANTVSLGQEVDAHLIDESNNRLLLMNRNQQSLFVINLETKEKEPSILLSFHPSAMGLSINGESLYIGSELGNLYRYNNISGNVKQIYSGNFEITHINQIDEKRLLYTKRIIMTVPTACLIFPQEI